MGIKHWRRYPLLVLACFVVLFTAVAAAPEAPADSLPVSKGAYRIPYANRTDVRFSNDHTNHPTTLNRVDMFGVNGTGSYQVVAAGDGWIDRIVDTNNTFCPSEPDPSDPDPCDGYGGPSAACCVRTDPTCNAACANNYVWIRHTNGEFTKYSHVQFNSVAGLGWSEGDFIQSGEVLGLEGDVGFAGGPHVHFEVAYPHDPSNYLNSAGFLVDDGDPTTTDYDRQNRIPYFCDIGFAAGGDQVTAATCSMACDSFVSIGLGVPDDQIAYFQADVMVDTFDGIPHVVASGGGEAFRAGQQVVLRPGFHAQVGSYFSASISACDTPGAP